MRGDFVASEQLIESAVEGNVVCVTLHSSLSYKVLVIVAKYKFTESKQRTRTDYLLCVLQDLGPVVPRAG